MRKERKEEEGSLKEKEALLYKKEPKRGRKREKKEY